MVANLPQSGPGRDHLAGELPAGGNEEGAGSHRRVAQLEVEDLGGRGWWAEAGQKRLEGSADNLLGEAARGVVGARATALFAGLDYEASRVGTVAGCLGPLAEGMGREGFEYRGVVLAGLFHGLLEGLHRARVEAAGLLEEAGAVRGGHLPERAGLHPDTKLAGADRRACETQDVVAHERLVDAPGSGPRRGVVTRRWPGRRGGGGRGELSRRRGSAAQTRRGPRGR